VITNTADHTASANPVTSFHETFAPSTTSRQDHTSPVTTLKKRRKKIKMKNKFESVHLRLESSLSGTQQMFEVHFNFANNSHYIIELASGESIESLSYKLYKFSIDILYDKPFTEEIENDKKKD
jgi:hypothetical protein